MEHQRKPSTQRILEAFTRFHRLNWRQSPIVGLKPSEIMVLYCLKKLVQPGTPGAKVSDIGCALRVTSPTITQLVNGLETNGLVERTTDTADRRAVRVKLTNQGEAAVKKAADKFFALFDGLVDYLGEDQSNQLAELLTKTFEYFKETRKKPQF